MSRAPETFSLLGKSQLRIQLDYSPTTSDLEVRYSYPVSTVDVSSERAIRIPREQILRDVLRHIEILFRGLLARVPDPSDRPSTPDKRGRPTGATIVIQDERYHHELPLAWLTYADNGPGSALGKTIKIDRTSFTPHELAAWDRLRQRIKGIAWTHYQGAVAQPLLGA